MVLDAVSNFVRGNTDAEVGTDDTTVSVADASIFPDPETDGEFNVVIWDANSFPRPDQDADVEIMRVTARDTTADELTVTRAQEMTSAASHPEGSAIHLSPTAKMFSDIESTFGDFWDAGTEELTADVNNTNTNTIALEAESASTEQLSSNIYFSSEFDTLQDAINQTQRDDVIFVTKLHNENVTIDERITLIGGGESVTNVGISSDSSDPTVKITENDVNIRGLGIENSGSGDALLFENSVQCCIMSSRIFRSRTVIDSDSQFVRIIGCNFAGEDIDVNGDENVVLGNVRVGTITDSGAGNEVANNT